MDYRQILGFDRDFLYGCLAGLIFLGFMAAILFTHAQVDQQTPENLSAADRTACQLAMIETNSTYRWNETTQSCEKQLDRGNRSAG